MKRSLWLLKFRARRLYYGYHEELNLYSCGAQLAEHLSPRLAEMGRKLDKMVDEIKARQEDA